MAFEYPMVYLLSETFVSRDLVPCAYEGEGNGCENIKIFFRLGLVHVLVGAVTLLCMNC